MCTEFRTSHASIALVESYVKQWRKLWSFAKTKRIIKWFPGSSLALNFWIRSSMVERTVLRAPAAFRVATNFHNGHYKQQGSNPFCFCERRVTFWNFTFELEVSFQKCTLSFQKTLLCFRKHLSVLQVSQVQSRHYLSGILHTSKRFLIGGRHFFGSILSF